MCGYENFLAEAELTAAKISRRTPELGLKGPFHRSPGRQAWGKRTDHLFVACSAASESEAKVALRFEEALQASNPFLSSLPGLLPKRRDRPGLR